jgi:glycosyltransferase involved in cell wall biosynthesis
VTKPVGISLITVCFNSVQTIEETILSVLSQSHPFIQYIVIDGGSTDGTLDILEKYRDKIDVLISEPDKGIYDAMNKGILHAKNEVIGLLNADDLYAEKDVVSYVASAFADPTLEVAFGDLVYFESNNPFKVVRYWKSSSFKAGLFGKGWAPAHPTFFVRQSVYQQYGLFNLDMKMGNDVELMMRFLEKYKVNSRYLPRILVKMRLGGVSNRTFKNILIQNQSILQAAKMLDISISPLQFWFGKIISRFSQFCFKPLTEDEKSYAK